MSIIEVDHLTKEYRLGALHGLKQTLLNTTARLTGKKVEERPLFMALDDVSFSIKQGEVVGIIGHNGAGKSTLLKMLAKISTPTSGSAKVNGRVAPLIEVGAGFVPDLTGRENVYLNGVILGMSRQEIDKKFDEIVDFAEMSEFIDTPVKRYSSGMQVKLAFSVATSIESDVLIVDEVLAVGDLAFQRKCFGRIEQMIGSSDKTVLVVSHNIRQITRLCGRTLLLDHGRLVADGLPVEVCNYYYAQSNKKIIDTALAKGKMNLSFRTSGEVELLSIDVLNEDGETVDSVVSGDPFRVRIVFDLKVNLEKPEIVIGTHTTDFVYLTSASTSIYENRDNLRKGTHEVIYEVARLALVPGVYCLKFILFDSNGVAIFNGETLKVFSVNPSSLDFVEANPGDRLFRLDGRWEVDGCAVE